MLILIKRLYYFLKSNKLKSVLLSLFFLLYMGRVKIQKKLLK